MKFLLVVLGLALLFAVSWPLALFLVILSPALLVLYLLLRLAGVVLAAVFALLKAVLFLPARILGYRG